jgi:hypothetical protein
MDCPEKVKVNHGGQEKQRLSVWMTVYGID